MAHKHSVYDTDPHFAIDPITRAITNQSTTKTQLMQYDHNSERFTFEIPRLVDGHDMQQCDKIEVHYINVDAATKQSNADVYIVDDMQISPESDDVVIFSWLISGNATQYAGTLNFIIRFLCHTGTTIDYAWGTDMHKGISVGGSFSNGEMVIAEYTDVLEKWKEEVLGGGGGGNKIYRHLFEGVGEGPEDLTLYAIYYSSSATPLTSGTITPDVFKNMHILPSSNAGYGGMYTEFYPVHSVKLMDTGEIEIVYFTDIAIGATGTTSCAGFVVNSDEVTEV